MNFPIYAARSACSKSSSTLSFGISEGVAIQFQKFHFCLSKGKAIQITNVIILHFKVKALQINKCHISIFPPLVISQCANNCWRYSKSLFSSPLSGTKTEILHVIPSFQLLSQNRNAYLIPNFLAASRLLARRAHAKVWSMASTERSESLYMCTSALSPTSPPHKRKNRIPYRCSTHRRAKSICARLDCFNPRYALEELFLRSAGSASIESISRNVTNTDLKRLRANASS